ncbi:hypothetical protein ACLMAL_30370 [Nocardia sp. CWNU-33]|uniref:hypothetical protein n=1 Tax=Nocardia sp. CWNU-33 TaxID=3392117 RepID=UPI00398E6521
MQLAFQSAAVAVLSVVTLSGIVAGATPGAGLPPLGSDFMWGVASAGFQNEGHAPDSNWSRYAASGAVEPYGDSVDFYYHYREDIALARFIGSASNGRASSRDYLADGGSGRLHQ